MKWSDVNKFMDLERAMLKKVAQMLISSMMRRYVGVCGV